MASGFITLPDGTDWSSRSTGYDLVLEQIMHELSNSDDEGILKNWIQYILPDEENGDIDSGYCFYKNGTESILRILDTRLMHTTFQQLFWNTVQSLSAKLTDETPEGFLVRQLDRCYTNSLSNPYKEPEDPDLNDLLSVGGFKIGR